MIKADLHVHSLYSEHPSEWFLQRLGAKESYTNPERVYELAKERGMDLITITDHNRINGSLLLKEKYPGEIITGLEATTYFPDDGCKIHVLVYGLNEEEFETIQKIRHDIYDFRNFLKDRNLAHSVAHATYSVNDRLDLEHLEKLILLFDVFEGINGARNGLNNRTWMRLLGRLTVQNIEELRRKHGIEPVSSDPWNKIFTGGSDDHGGIFVGKTYTVADAKSVDEFLEAIKSKKCTPRGRHNDYQSLAFTMYKIAFDFSKTKRKAFSKNFLHRLSEYIFEKKSLSFKDEINFRKLHLWKSQRDDNITKLTIDLLENLRIEIQGDIEHKLNIVYDKIAAIADEFSLIVLRSFENDFHNGEIIKVIQSLSSSILGVFLSIPFFTTMFHMYKGRDLLARLEEKFLNVGKCRQKRILWFTDTITDMNGVAVTMNKIARLAYDSGRDIFMVTSLTEKERDSSLPSNVINLPNIYAFNLPGYEHMTLKIPSVLKAIKELYQYEPDEIYISSPGPMGLLGLLMSRLLCVKVVGVYHTDFTLFAEKLIGDQSVVTLLEAYMKWFFSSVDVISVPTIEYFNVLEERGYDRSRMRIFPRGIESDIFSPISMSKEMIMRRFEIPDGINLLYAGRISRDKNIDFLFDVFAEIHNSDRNVNLVLAGDGPYCNELREKYKNNARIIFTGRLIREDLAVVYSGSDMLVFPSTTDTFGMVVLEAQSCGLPALVSDRGGPQEIVRHEKTGFIIEANNTIHWAETIEYVIEMMKKDRPRYDLIRQNARNHVITTYDWNAVLMDIAGETGEKVVPIEDNTSDCREELVSA